MVLIEKMVQCDVLSARILGSIIPMGCSLGVAHVPNMGWLIEALDD